MTTQAPSLPWYDSVWLHCYWQAHALVVTHYPSRQAEFEAAFDPLRTDATWRTASVSQVFDEQTLGQIKQFIAALLSECLEKQELLSFGRTVLHDQPLFNALQQRLTPLVSELAGEPLEPSYNFLSLYNNLGVCDMHMDAPNAKWTLDVCIDQSAVWPIYIADPQPWPEMEVRDQHWSAQVKEATTFRAHELTPGNAILFSGSSQWHYRERIAQRQANNYCHLLFFHFYPVGTGALLDPEGWADLFDMPALAQLRYSHGGPSFEFKV